MNDRMIPPITADDEWLAAQASGALSEAKQFLLDCQADIRPEVREAYEASHHVAGAILENAPGTALSPDFFDRLNGRLSETGKASVDPVSSQPDSLPDWMPAPLAALMLARGIKLKWRAAGAGLQRARVLLAETGERIYLLRARAGFSVPLHGHRGEEWTLVLQGGYHVGAQGYVPGDLHQENATCTHSLRVDDDGPCISLIVDEGPLKFDSPLLRAIQPLLGV